MFVTDHFPNGISTDKNESWTDIVNSFCRGYDVAAAKGKDVGLDVYLAWEIGYGWAHFLTYGLSKDWLIANPEIPSWDLLRYCKQVHADGGAIVHAHPFREGVDIVQLAPHHVDAIEVLNGARVDADNQHALDYATSFNLPKVAGSDIHYVEQQRLCGMAFTHRLRDGNHYVDAIRAGEGIIFDSSQ